jgi:hypothetical protein
MSVNQPALPHAIIAVNATDIGVHEDEWDVEKATRNLLASVSNALSTTSGVPEFIQLARLWRSRGRSIDSVVDLIHCYYSSFSVVRLPVKGRYGRLGDQVSKLHHRIEACCEMSYHTKRSARMLLTSDALQIYLGSAFDHFCLELERPFNFIDASLKVNPIPLDFGGHILQLARAIDSVVGRQSGPYIFHHLSYMVASCVLLDVVRNLKGTQAFHLVWCHADNLQAGQRMSSANMNRRLNLPWKVSVTTGLAAFLMIRDNASTSALDTILKAIKMKEEEL